MEKISVFHWLRPETSDEPRKSQRISANVSFTPETAAAAAAYSGGFQHSHYDITKQWFGHKRNFYTLKVTPKWVFGRLRVACGINNPHTDTHKELWLANERPKGDLIAVVTVYVTSCAYEIIIIITHLPIRSKCTQNGGPINPFPVVNGHI